MTVSGPYIVPNKCSSTKHNYNDPSSVAHAYHAQTAVQCPGTFISLRFTVVNIHLTAEPHPANPQPPLRKVTYAQLYDLVADLVSALLAQGLKPGDRVASYSSNCIVSIQFNSFMSTCYSQIRHGNVHMSTTHLCDLSGCFGG